MLIMSVMPLVHVSKICTYCINEHFWSTHRILAMAYYRSEDGVEYFKIVWKKNQFSLNFSNYFVVNNFEPFKERSWDTYFCTRETPVLARHNDIFVLRQFELKLELYHNLWEVYNNFQQLDFVYKCYERGVFIL